MPTLFLILPGLIGSIVLYVLFYTLGITCLPERVLHTAKLPAFPALAGAAIFSVLSWFSIQWNISLNQFFLYLFVSLLLLVLGQLKKVVHYFRLQTKGSISLFAAYIFLYLLVYLFLPLPDPHRFLPLGQVNNLDIFSYINITQYLLALGPSNLAHINYLDPHWIYYQTPAVYYFHALMSLFYKDNALTAAMPLLYSITSVLGLIIAYYCHTFFKCSRRLSFGIAALMLCGFFFRYIIGRYFLSSLIGIFLWLAFLSEILQQSDLKKENRLDFLCFIIIITLYQSLVFLVYPIFFLFNLVLYFVCINFMLFYLIRPFSWKMFIRKSLALQACILVSTCTLVLIFPHYTEQVFRNLLYYAHYARGWGLPLLSPLAILGLPTALTLDTTTLIPVLFAFFLFLLSLIYCFHTYCRFSQSPAVRLWFYLTIVSFFGYLFYFCLKGPTQYSPWKLASYFMLPLAGTLWAIIFDLLKHLSFSRYIIFCLILFCILGNAYEGRFKYMIPPLSQSYQKLSKLNHIPSRDIFIKMASPETTFLSAFYIRNQQLHFFSFSYYPRETLAQNPVNVPFFLESSHGCDFFGTSSKNIPIPPIGCLYMEFPSMDFERTYSLQDNLPFLETTGIRAPENKNKQADVVYLTFYTDVNKLVSHPRGYFDIELSLPEKSQTQWVQIPYTMQDWKKTAPHSSVRQIRIKLDLSKLTHHPQQVDFLKFSTHVSNNTSHDSSSLHYPASNHSIRNFLCFNAQSRK